MKAHGVPGGVGGLADLEEGACVHGAGRARAPSTNATRSRELGPGSPFESATGGLVNSFTCATTEAAKMTRVQNASISGRTRHRVGAASCQLRTSRREEVRCS